LFNPTCAFYYLIIIEHYCVSEIKRYYRKKTRILKSIHIAVSTIRDAFFVTARPSVVIITAEFTQFVLVWVTNSSGHSSTHSTLRWLGNAQGFIAARLPARLAGFTRADVINLRREFHGTPVRIDVNETRRNVVAPRHKRPRTCESTRRRVRHKLFTPRGRPPGQVPRHVKRVRVKYDGVSGHVIFFRLFFTPPRNLISATPSRHVVAHDVRTTLSVCR